MILGPPRATHPVFSGEDSFSVRAARLVAPEAKAAAR
jgi:hypothetical protein